MAPFYPIKAKEKGVKVMWIGVVIGTMAIFQIIGSFMVGHYLKQLGGRNCVIFTSTLLIIFQTTCLGLLEYVDSDDWFLYFSFIAQLFGGLGAGGNSTSSMAILSSFPHHEREKYIGLVEASFGIGLLFGPLIGSMLYSFGGYVVPFFTFCKFQTSKTDFVHY